jgi:S-adenosylmethionine:tRNA ribosyltransferase-isomerase
MIESRSHQKQCDCGLTSVWNAGWRTIEFKLPRSLEASEPPEARGLQRDHVRLLVSRIGTNRLVHTAFNDLAQFLDAGDVVAINTSGTMKAALNARRSDGTPLELHLSTHLPADLWSIELRRPRGGSTDPFYEAIAGESLALAGGGSVKLHTPYSGDNRAIKGGSVRLWIATLRLPMPVLEYLDRYGFPIRYSYVDREWPSDYYQTVFASEIGSAEMPSAGRAFTPELITRLVAKGVQFVPLILHTGVASLEQHEPPYEEYFRVPASSANQLNAARSNGAKVIAVGTTVIRALETVTDEQGVVHPGEGWTNLIVDPKREIRAVDGMITGFHEPKATHLAMLEALAGFDHICLAYEAALKERYLWHEFGDLHLIMP